MGGGESKSSTPDPDESKHLYPINKPWRKLHKTEKQELKQLMKDISQQDSSNKAKILLFGPIGAGKSSFINSCLSVSLNRRCHIALTGPTMAMDGSYTCKFQHYGNNTLLKSIQVADCMGIEGEDGKGLNENDIVKLLNGHIKDDYKFDTKRPIKEDDKYYIKIPKYTDKVHSVVFVLSARAVFDGIQSTTLQKIKSVQQDIKDADISSILVLTKVDLLCEKVNEDVSKMFRSIKVHSAVRKASELFSIPIGSIHPVINYEDDIITSPEKNIHLLLALRQILENAHDRMNHNRKKSRDSY